MGIGSSKAAAAPITSPATTNGDTKTGSAAGGTAAASSFRLNANEEVCLLLSHALPGLVEGDADKPRHATEGSIERAVRAALGPDRSDDSSYTQFAALCEAEAKVSNASALNNLGWVKLYGLGDANKTDKDEVAAVGLFDAAAQRGSVVAENNLLICQIRGVGTGDGAGSITVNGTDVVTASIFSQMRNRCCTVGFFGGGSTPHLTPQFVFAGLTVLAEQKQCAGAQYNVGCAHYLGVGTKPDVKRAVAYFQRSANAGFLPAMYALAKCLADGKGVAANPEQAQELMRRVSEEQNPPRPKSAIAALIASNDETERERSRLDAKHTGSDSSSSGSGDGKTAAAATPTTPLPPLGEREIQWVKDAKEATAVTWKLALSHDGWNREGGDVAEGVEVYARQFTTTLKDYAPKNPPYLWTTSQKTYKIYRCHALVGCTVKQAFDLLTDENVPAWNPAVDGNKILQKLDAETDITYTLASPSVGGAVSARDFVNTRRREFREFIACSEMGMNTTNSGTVHEAALPNAPVAGATAPLPPNTPPPLPGTPTTAIRGFNGHGAYVVLPVPSTHWDEAKDGPVCHVIWIMNADLKGWLPGWLIESTLCGVMNRWVKTVRSAIEQRHKTALRTSHELLPSPSGLIEHLKPKPEAA